MAERVRIGDMLIAAGLIDQAQLEAALASQKESGRRLGEELVATGVLTEVQMTQVLSNQLSVPWVSLYHVEFAKELLNLVPADVAKQLGLIPIYIRKVRQQGETLFVAMYDPTNDAALDYVSSVTEMPCKPMIAPPSEIEDAIRVYYFGGQEVPAPRRSSHPPPLRQSSPPPKPAPTVDPTAKAAGEAEAVGKAEPREATTKKVKKGRGKKKPAAKESSTQAAEPAAQPAPSPKAGGRMVTLTLLDGTQVRLPAPGTAAAREESVTLTASDLIAALLVRSQGEGVSDSGWEPLFATLLQLLIKKGLIADWEFVEELKNNTAASGDD